MPNQFICYKIEKINKIRDYFDGQKIKYEYKVKSQLGQWSGNGTIRRNMGSIGNPSSQMYEYEILIYKKDADRVAL